MQIKPHLFYHTNMTQDCSSKHRAEIVIAQQWLAAQLGEWTEAPWNQFSFCVRSCKRKKTFRALKRGECLSHMLPTILKKYNSLLALLRLSLSKSCRQHPEKAFYSLSIPEETMEKTEPVQPVNAIRKEQNNYVLRQ